MAQCKRTQGCLYNLSAYDGTQKLEIYIIQVKLFTET